MVYHSMVFLLYLQSFANITTIILEHFYHLRKKPHAYQQTLPNYPQASSSHWQPETYFLFLQICHFSLDISYEGNHAVMCCLFVCGCLHSA